MLPTLTDIACLDEERYAKQKALYEKSPPIAVGFGCMKTEGSSKKIYAYDMALPLNKFGNLGATAETFSFFLGQDMNWKDHVNNAIPIVIPEEEDVTLTHEENEDYLHIIQELSNAKSVYGNVAPKQFEIRNLFYTYLVDRTFTSPIMVEYQPKPTSVPEKRYVTVKGIKYDHSLRRKVFIYKLELLEDFMYEKNIFDAEMKEKSIRSEGGCEIATSIQTAIKRGAKIVVHRGFQDFFDAYYFLSGGKALPNTLKEAQSLFEEMNMCVLDTGTMASILPEFDEANKTRDHWYPGLRTLVRYVIKNNNLLKSNFVTPSSFLLDYQHKDLRHQSPRYDVYQTLCVYNMLESLIHSYDSGTEVWKKWFKIKNGNFTSPYKSLVSVSMWGGYDTCHQHLGVPKNDILIRVKFKTGASENKNKERSIQLLSLTPSSIPLKKVDTDPNFPNLAVITLSNPKGLWKDEYMRFYDMYSFYKRDDETDDDQNDREEGEGKDSEVLPEPCSPSINSYEKNSDGGEKDIHYKVIKVSPFVSLNAAFPYVIECKTCNLFTQLKDVESAEYFKINGLYPHIPVIEGVEQYR